MSTFPEYTLPQWLEHTKGLAQTQLPSEPTRAAAVVAQYFHAQFRNPLEAEWKRRRFVAARRYFDRNSAHFDQAAFAVIGEKESLWTFKMEAGLWSYFSGIPDDHILDSPAPDLIMKLGETVAANVEKAKREAGK